jgi:hypothetical protein
MTAAGGSDVVLLMVSGVAVVIITLRVMARAYRIKQQALEQQPAAKVAPPKEQQSARSRRALSVLDEGV